MVPLNTPPILTGNPGKVQGLIGDLIASPTKATFFLEADEQDYTRAACLKAIGKALEAYANRFLSLRDDYPNINRFIALAQTDEAEKILEHLEDLDAAWYAVNEFIVRQRPEGNMPIRQQLEHLRSEKELDRLKRFASLPDKKALLLENLTVEQMQELMARARAWDELRLNIQQGAMEAITNDIPPAARALAIESRDLQAIADIPAQAINRQVAADLEAGGQIDPAAGQRAVRTVSQASHPASAATTAVAAAAGRSTFRQGITQALQTPVSSEALQLRQSLHTAGVDRRQTAQILNHFEDQVGRGQDYTTALKTALSQARVAPREAERIVSAASASGQTYHQFVKEFGPQAEQLRQAAKVNQSLVRAAAPSASQLVGSIQKATGVSQDEAIRAVIAIEREVAQNQPHQVALAEGLAQLGLGADQTQAAYNTLAGAAEDYVEANQGLRVQPITPQAAQSIGARFTQQIQAATGSNPGAADQVRSQFEASLASGKSANQALSESLPVLSLSPERSRAAARELAAPAQLYGQFTRLGKTQLPAALAAPQAQEQFIQLLTHANISQAQATQIGQRFAEAIRLGQDPQGALANSLGGLALSPERLSRLSAALTPFAQEYAALIRAAPVSRSGLPASFTTAAVPLTTLAALNNRSLAENGPVISHSALEQHQLGVRSDSFNRAFLQSSHQADFNPALIEQHQEALRWLENHPEHLEGFGLATPPPLEHFAFEMDAQPASSRTYLSRRFEFLNQQLAARNVQGFAGWLKAPGLKWQAGWAKFAADHPRLTGFAGFVASPKDYFRNKVGGWLAGKGLGLVTKSAAGKALGGLLTKVGGKLAGKGLAKLIGGVVGTLIGGPLGTVIGIALGIVLEKVGGWLLRNLKKLAIALGALMALIVGLLAKAAALLPALLTGIGIWLTPVIPIVGIPALIAGLGGLSYQVGAWLGKGGISGALSSLGSSLGNFLGLSTSAAVPAYVMAAPFVAVGGLVAVSVFSSIALSSAFVLPPSEEQKLEIAIDPRTGKPLGCTTGPFPLPGTNSASSPIARRAWEVVNNLQQGFWCYWNNSPDYPELFNLSLYQTSPFPTYPGEINQCADCLFWCTWLVQKAYGGGIPNALGARAMMESWPNPLTSPVEATPENIQPGSVIFFETSSGSPGVNHVAVVYSVSDDSVVYVQSNSPAKRGSLTFNDSGVGVQSLPGIRVVNFGTP